MARRVVLIAVSLALVSWLIWTWSQPRPQAQSQSSADLEAQLRALTPPELLDMQERIRNEGRNPIRIDILHARADLDGSGKFDFIVALYNTRLGATLRVLKETGGSLQVLADSDPDLDIGGPGAALELEDIDNDGKPEIVVGSSGMTVGYALGIFQWTGSSLRLITPSEAMAGSPELEDLDGDGILEIIVPPGRREEGEPRKPYEVYRFNGLQYELAATPATDPRAGGGPEVRARGTRIHPDRFPLAEIRQARSSDAPQGGVVTVRLDDVFTIVSGGIPPVRPISVSEIDTNTLILGRTIRPLRTQILPASAQEEADRQAGGFEGDFLQAQFSRREVLRFLPRTQLNKPLEPGDKLTLQIHGKMRNGAPLTSSVTVRIVPD